MMTSEKPIKDLEEIIGDKKFFFPDELSNDRIPDKHKKCIFIQVNGEKHYIPTGENVSLTRQQFSTLKDSGIILPHYTYATNPEFDPIQRPYDI